MSAENDCIYTIYLYIFQIVILQLKFWFKAIQNRLKVYRVMATRICEFVRRTIALLTYQVN